MASPDHSHDPVRMRAGVGVQTQLVIHVHRDPRADQQVVSLADPTAGEIDQVEVPMVNRGHIPDQILIHAGVVVQTRGVIHVHRDPQADPPDGILADLTRGETDRVAVLMVSQGHIPDPIRIHAGVGVLIRGVAHVHRDRGADQPDGILAGLTRGETDRVEVLTVS